MQRVPEFGVGDLVSERAAMPKRVGTVVEVYQFVAQIRYVIRFEDGFCV